MCGACMREFLCVVAHSKYFLDVFLIAVEKMGHLIDSIGNRGCSGLDPSAQTWSLCYVAHMFCVSSIPLHICT
jgi:hypothetical protein